MKTSKLKILSVKIRHRLDEHPDTSLLGEYSNKATSPFSIDRRARGDQERNEFQFFNPSSNYVDKAGDPRTGLTPKEVQTYVEQDYQRMERLGRGDWNCIGIDARAEVWNPVSQVVHRISSGGLWGVESDSEASYIKGIESEELSGLRRELMAFGLSRGQIATAMKNVEHEN